MAGTLKQSIRRVCNSGQRELADGGGIEPTIGTK
jgi:hypothetical protein